LLCSKAEEVKGKSRKRPTCKKPLRKPDEEFSKKLRFYTPEVHQAAFVLPKFVTEAIKEAEGKYAETAKSEQGASDESEKGDGAKPAEGEGGTGKKKGGKKGGKKRKQRG
jgi:hypothetical protein